ncbi:hypothetical protein Q7C36_003295 [Tachysurus vachellii]|uniref:Uncharacterized protein n=1 Tax=Tachysurus vachellii TaxID=175792 RepID=A0AA88NRJ8_TACVA|nr:hypothetical protein Q7C36_003295 [Tachysurus vachellii]
MGRMWLRCATAAAGCTVRACGCPHKRPLMGPVGICLDPHHFTLQHQIFMHCSTRTICVCTHQKLSEPQWSLTGEAGASQAVWAGCGPAAHWQVLMALLAKAKGAVLALGSRCSLPLPARAVPLAAGITLRASLPTIITNSSCRWRQAGAPVAASSTAFSHLHIPPHKMLKHTPF